MGAQRLQGAGSHACVIPLERTLKRGSLTQGRGYFWCCPVDFSEFESKKAGEIMTLVHLVLLLSLGFQEAPLLSSPKGLGDKVSGKCSLPPVQSGSGWEFNSRPVLGLLTGGGDKGPARGCTGFWERQGCDVMGGDRQQRLETAEDPPRAPSHQDLLWAPPGAEPETCPGEA